MKHDSCHLSFLSMASMTTFLNLQEPNAARLVQGSFPSQDIPVAGTQFPIPMSSEHCDHNQPVHESSVHAMY